MSRSRNSRRGAVKGRIGSRGCSWGCTICHPEDYRRKLIAPVVAAEFDDDVAATMHYDSADWQYEGWPCTAEYGEKLWNWCVGVARTTGRDPYDVYDEELGDQLANFRPSSLRVKLIELL